MANITVLQNDNPSGTRVTLDDNRIIINNNFTAINTELGQLATTVAGKAPAGTGAAGAVTKTDVGLSNADNTSDANKPVSIAQAAAIGDKYTRPGTGIPETDLDAATQATLGAVAGKYVKPGTGIPETDLDAALQAAIPNLDAGNNAGIGPTIYIPSSAFRFEKLLSQNGAVLNGTTDDQAAFQSALNALPAGRWNEVWIPQGVASVKFNSGLSLDVSNTLLHMLGATMDFTGMATGQALTVTGSGVVTTYGQVMGGLDRAFISGPGRTSAVDGVLFTGSNVSSPNTGSARSMFSNCWIRNWRKAVTWSHRGYLSTLFNCEVGSSLIGLYSAANAFDAYENVGILRGVVGNNDVNIYLEDGLMTLQGVSIDYANYVQIATRVGFLQLDGCHIEYTLKANTYGVAGGIYSGNAPLCAFDMQPGVTAALRSDIGLSTTSPSNGQNWVGLKMNGGLWAPTAPRSGTNANTLLVHVSQAGNALFSTCGRPKYQFGGFGTGSGYVCHNLATYNTLSTVHTSPVDWQPGFWDGSSDVPNQIVDNVSTYTSNGTRGLSVCPANNQLGTFGISGTADLYSFEYNGGIGEGVYIVEDSDGTTTAILPPDRLNGTAGRVGASGTFAHTGTTSLKLTKTGAAGEPFKVAINVPIPVNAAHRPVFRGVVARPSTGGPTLGSINVNLAWVKEDLVFTGDTGVITLGQSNARLVSGNPATAASGAAGHSATAFKATSGSVFAAVTDLTVGTWFSFQLNAQPDLFKPTWATSLRVELDLKEMGPGDINFDSFDLQYM